MPVPPKKLAAAVWLERGLFASRWLMAPFYVGLVVGLAVLLVVFARELAHDAPALIAHGQPDEAIVMALSLIDLSLAGNLLLIVIFSGYENFVSSLDIGEHPDRPEWMAGIDFSGLKMKLIASVIAISAVALLRAFMGLAEQGVEPDPAKLGWMVGLHGAFLATGVLMGVMDWLAGKRGH
jgi:uncharacterized protein (TIGR00645 family)